MEVKTNSPVQTKEVARSFAKSVKSGDVIALFGDLGSGKTVFTQGLASALGIKRKITSPTFVFMRSYPFILGRKPLTFYHLDLYRGQNAQDFEALGLDEIFQDKAIIVLEWADRIREILPTKRIDIIFKTTGPKSRTIIFNKK